MKIILLLTLIAVSNYFVAQLYKPSINQTGFAVELGGSGMFSMLPARMNTFIYSSGYLSSEKFETYNSLAFAVKGDVSISPLYHDNFAYFFTTNGMVGWLGSNGQSNFYSGHHFRVGSQRLKVLFELGNFKIRRTSYYKFEPSSNISGSSKIARSVYDDVKKIKFGIHYSLKNEQTLCVMITQEKYVATIYNENAKGVYIEYANKDRVSFFADIVMGHPIKGYYALSAPFSQSIEKTGLAFQFGVRKSFLFSRKYLELNYGDEY